MQDRLLKTVLKGNTSLLDTLNYETVNNYFREEVYQDFVIVLLQIYGRTQNTPTYELLKDYYTREKHAEEELVLLEKLNHRRVKPYKNSEVVSYLDILNKEVVKSRVQDYLEYTQEKLETESLSNIEETLSELKTEVILAESNIGHKDITEIFVHNGTKASETFKEKYEQREKNKGMTIAKYGYPEMDDTLGGIKNIDLVHIVGSTKQYKSTLLRNIGISAVNQAKNPLYITLEMSVDEIENSFAVMHMNNKERFPNFRRTTYKEITEATAPNKEQIFEAYEDLTNSNDLGMLYLLQPSVESYGYDNLVSDYHRVNNKHMKVDMILLDSTNLMLDSSIDAVNFFIRQLRKFILRYKIPVIAVSQINRQGFKEALLSEGNLYDLTAIRNYNEIESSSTVVISTFQSPEMKENNQLQIQHLLSRETELFQPAILHTDAEVGNIVSLSQNQVDYTKDEGAAILNEISTDLF